MIHITAVAFLTLSAWVTLPVVGMATNADSLSKVLLSAPRDTAKVRMLAELALELTKSDPARSLELSKETLHLSHELGFREGVALGYLRLALSLKQLGNYDSAFYYYFRSRDLYNELRHTTGEAKALMGIGTLHNRIGSYDSAAVYLFKALHLAESNGNIPLQGSVLNNLGLVMRQLGKTIDAIRFYSKSLQICKETRDLPGAAVAHENLGIAYTDVQDFAEAENHYSLALTTYETLNDTRGLGRININMAAMLQAQGRYPEAFERASRALRYEEEIDNPNGTALAYLSMADVSREMRKYDDAVKYAGSSLGIAVSTGNRQNELEVYQLLHNVYSEQGTYERAYEYLGKATALKDSLFNVAKESIIGDLQAKYETQKKENEIQLLNKDNEIQTLTIGRQRVVRNSLIGGGALVIIIGLLFFNRYRIAQKHKRQAERVRISSDLHDEIGSTLSSISMYSAYGKGKPTEAVGILEEISSSSQEMIDDMNDIIWSINPRNDTLEKTVDRLHTYASHMAESKRVVLDFQSDGIMRDLVLSMEQRKNLYLICKEAINNALKYSGCKTLSVQLHKNKKHLSAQIRDDGKGFDPQGMYEGNGLKNMRQRAEQIRAVLSIQSSTSGTDLNVDMFI
jgi:signal transduction histidine kinase